MRKVLTFITCAVAALSLNLSAFAETNNYQDIAATTTIADYMASYFPEDVLTNTDKEIIETIRHLETQTNVNTSLNLKGCNETGIVAYLGEPTECFKVYANLSTVYGFVPMRLHFFMWDNTLGYDGLGSKNKNFASFKNEYIRVAEIAKQLAPTLKKDTNMATVQNIYNYVTTHAATSGNDDGSEKYTGFYDGLNIACGGYAGAIAQLCRLNHIPCEVVYGRHNETPHSWNKVNIDGKDYYIDGALRNGIMETLPSEYTIYDRMTLSMDSGKQI